jgi:hypothetical protein
MRGVARTIGLAVILLVVAASAQAGEVDRLYVIDCGWARADDQSRWSPGVKSGVPIDLSDECYLIHHSREGYLLWDTGITGRLAALPDGQYVSATGQTWHRTRTLAAALAALGVAPADIRFIAISHFHPDHTGNVEEFPDSTLIMQKAEWDYAIKLPLKPFSPDHKARLIEGDEDLFGDGSVTALSTPGHAGTPVTARRSCTDRSCRTVGRCRAFPVELGQSPHPRFQLRQGAIGGIVGKDRARARRQARATVDQPRQAVERRTPPRARIL